MTSLKQDSKLRVGIVAVFAALLTLTGCTAPAQTPGDNGPGDVLHFNQGGTFKILSLSDIQDGANVSPLTIKLITLALDSEKPDLVVLNGDNIFDWAPSLLFSGGNVQKSIGTFLKPITDRGIPFALVFGNHDRTLPMGQQAQWDYIHTFPGALGTANTIGDRVGNYNVVVDDRSGKPALNLWFLNSGGHTLSATGADMLPGQLDWYKTASDALTTANGGDPVPSIVFQHIPVPQIYDLLTPVAKGTPGAVKGSGAHSGGYYVAGPAVTDGTLGEGPCPLDTDKAEFDTWLQQGDVMGAVFGHDHNNSFGGRVQDIRLMYDAGTTFYSYGNGNLHGVRVLEFNEGSVQQYQTHMVYWKDLTKDPIPVNAQFDGTFAHGAQYLYIAIGALILLALVGLVIVVVRRIRRRRNAS